MSPKAFTGAKSEYRFQKHILSKHAILNFKNMKQTESQEITTEALNELLIRNYEH